MGLFKKKPDMQCWNCTKLISHKKVKWRVRKIGWDNLPPNDQAIIKELEQKIKEESGKIDDTSSPNQIFGLLEYEYRGQCPECNAEQRGFWFSKDSWNKISGVLIAPKRKPFGCTECEEVINREFQIWYSIMVQEEDKARECLVTLCPNCNTEQEYPFEYNLETGIIE